MSVVAFAAYVTVRSRACSSLDESLPRGRTRRPSRHARTPAAQRIPSWALGAADVGISSSTRRTDGPRLTRAAHLAIGQTEVAVARGPENSSARTVWIAAAVPRRRGPAGDGQALVLAQSLEPTDQMLDRLGLVMLLSASPA